MMTVNKLNNKYSLDSYCFPDEIMKKETIEMIKDNKPITIIISNGGMGGAHLLSVFRTELNSEVRSIKVDSGLVISLMKTSYQVTVTELLTYDAFFMDGFQRIFDEGVIEEFYSFSKMFLIQGGRLFLKGNPSEGIERFKSDFSNYPCNEIKLDKVKDKVLNFILDKFIVDNNWTITSEKRNILLSKPYKSYRKFQATIVCCSLNLKDWYQRVNI